MKENTRPTITVILGAGASRDVSYATGLTRSANDPGPSMLSPLDSDFFDLLQQLEARTEPGPTKDSMCRIIRKAVNYKGEPLWQSMEKMFYSLHVRAVLDFLLFRGGGGRDPGHRLIEDFLASIRALLREAHGTRPCDNHRYLFQNLRHPDAVLTFNYDFVAERALTDYFCSGSNPDRTTPFGEWLYGLGERAESTPTGIPTLYKLHGSLNWRLEEDEGGETQNARPEWPGNWVEFAKELVYEGTDRDEYSRHNHWRPPVLLPYWEKRVEAGLWLKLWRAAAEQLRRTDILIIWGYSLPTTDLKARELVTLAFEKREAKLSRIVVIDPSKETQERWRGMFVRKAFFRYQSFEEFRPHWVESGWRESG